MSVTLDGFSRGMDVSREAYASDPRTLALLVNAHLTRGGDAEQRKAFVAKFAVPGSFGLTQLRDVLYVFGGTDERPAGLPGQIAYQGLPHPEGDAMIGVRSVAVFADALYVVAEYAGGTLLHWYDAELVGKWVDGRARGSFYVVSGSAGPDNRIVEVLVDGAAVLGAPVAYQTSHATTAAAVAAQITATGIFTAEAVGQQVFVIAPTTSTDWNGKTIAVTVAGDVATSLVAKMGGGGGADGLKPGAAVLTYDDKLYSVSGPRLHFSDVFDPTQVQPSDDGAGYVDLSTSAEGTDDLVGLAPYYQVLAVFGRKGAQVWSVDVDDTLNARVQTVPDAGLVGSRALNTWRDGSLQFLTRRGVKTLQSRDSSGRGTVGDFSNDIDKRLVAHLNGLTAAERAAAILLTEPEDGRLWLITGSRIFVWSQFSAERVAGWSEYEPGLAFTDYAVIDHRLYLRAGDQLYLYGGDSGDVYDAAPVTLRLQFLGGGNAASAMKAVEGFDLGATGEWDVYLLPDFKNPATAELLAQIDGPTFDQPWHPAVGWSAFFALELRRAKADRGAVSTIIIHAATDASR